MSKRIAFVLGSAVILSAALYRPVIMWAKNAWDISAPHELLLLGLAAFIMALVPYAILAGLGFRPLPIGLAVGGLLFVLLDWFPIDVLTPLWWLVLVTGAAAVSYHWVGDRALRATCYVAIAVLGIAPIIQLVIAHIVQSDPYPIVDLAPRTTAEASSEVEDVLLLVVDTYPGPVIAEDWLDHDPAPLETRLTNLGYTVWDNAFSQHSFTGLAVPSLLELQPITTPELAAPWGNRTSTYDIIRGNNLVASTLRSAGYAYTHLESGWDGGACGAVDLCYPAPFLNELTWEFLRPTVIGNWMVGRYGAYSVASTVAVAENLLNLAPIFGDGQHDYVYAHMLLPHPPVVANSQCEPEVSDLGSVTSFDPENPGGGDRERFDAQLTCVDSLLMEVAAIAGPKTAVLITGDHGTSTNGQVGTPAATWSDADIAERLSIFLAYKLPPACSPATIRTNIEAMKAIMTCATDIEPPINNGRYLIEARNPMWVASERMNAIIDRLGRHEIDPE